MPDFHPHGMICLLIDARMGIVERDILPHIGVMSLLVTTDDLTSRFLLALLWVIILLIRNGHLLVSVPILFRLLPSLHQDVDCLSIHHPVEATGVLLEALLMIGAEVPIEV